jgi:peptide/nickel transport system ATP-binding protein
MSHYQLGHKPGGSDILSFLSVEGLGISYEIQRREYSAVNDVNFELNEGESMALVGESGSGKSTVGLSLMGLLPPSASISGTVELSGDDIMLRGEPTVRPHRWCDIAMVFQGAMNAFNPVKTIGTQIAEPMLLHDTHTTKAANSRVGDLLELVGISRSRADRYPHEFSGGMRQRAAIAMALACEPKVLLADEPTTALDVMVQAQILELLIRLTDELGLAMILVTHDLPVVAQVCKRAAVMYAGKIVEEGSTSDLYHDPRHPYTRMLFAATPDLYGNDEVLSIPGAPPRLDRPIAGCSFAPRCDRAFDACRQNTPAQREVAPRRFASCHLNELFTPTQASA